MIDLFLRWSFVIGLVLLIGGIVFACIGNSWGAFTGGMCAALWLDDWLAELKAEVTRLRADLAEREAPR